MKLKNLLMLMLTATLIASCVEDEFSTPDVTITEPVIDGSVITIDAVFGFLEQAINDGESTFTFEDTNSFVEGYVISSDEAGNFFEEIYIQDNLENPTRGLRILIDENPLYTRYEMGRKIYVKLDGLTVGYDSGVMSLGIGEGTEVGQIPGPQETDFIQRSAEIGTLVPLPINLDELSADKLALYVTVADAQFNRNQVLIANPLTFAAEPTDEFDGERILEDCGANGATVVFSTSTFADFKGLELPATRGRLNAILTLNFFGEEYNLVVNSASDIMFDSTERCDPIELSCGLASSVGATNLFSDDFEGQSPFSPISGNGWTNYIEAGTETWEAYTSGGTNSSQGVSARVGSFQSGDDSSIAWLITPAIDLDSNNGVTFSFESSNSFSDGSTLEILFSPDWDGTEANITSATWGVIPDAYVVQDSDFFGAWFESGDVDLSCGSGVIYIAFKYTGSGQSDFDGTYELDFVTVDAQ